MEKEIVCNDELVETSSKALKLVANARSMAKWFSIDLSIKLFGIEIISWHYPPIEQRKEVKS